MLYAMLVYHPAVDCADADEVVRFAHGLKRINETAA